jgi:hypothetical protein
VTSHICPSDVAKQAPSLWSHKYHLAVHQQTLSLAFAVPHESSREGARIPKFRLKANGCSTLAPHQLSLTYIWKLFGIVRLHQRLLCLLALSRARESRFGNGFSTRPQLYGALQNLTLSSLRVYGCAIHIQLSRRRLNLHINLPTDLHGTLHFLGL